MTKIVESLCSVYWMNEIDLASNTINVRIGVSKEAVIT